MINWEFSYHDNFMFVDTDGNLRVPDADGMAEGCWNQRLYRVFCRLYQGKQHWNTSSNSPSVNQPVYQWELYQSTYNEQSIWDGTDKYPMTLLHRNWIVLQDRVTLAELMLQVVEDVENVLISPMEHLVMGVAG